MAAPHLPPLRTVLLVASVVAICCRSLWWPSAAEALLQPLLARESRKLVSLRGPTDALMQCIL